MDEKQLQLLYNEYAKGKGFKDYNEFKVLMSDSANRKLFFDDSNKELGFADYNEFEGLLGVKKKDGGTPSQTSSKTIQSKAPSFSEVPLFGNQPIAQKVDSRAGTLAGMAANQKLSNLESTIDEYVQTSKKAKPRLGREELVTTETIAQQKLAQAALPVLKQKRDAVVKESAQAFKEVEDDFIKTGKYKDYIDDKGVINEQALLNKSLEYANQYGGDRNVRELIHSNLRQAVEFEKIKPQVETNFQKLFKEQTGKTPEEYYEGKNAQLLKEAKGIEQDIVNRFDSEKTRTEAILKEKAETTKQKYQQIADQLAQQYPQGGAEYEASFNELNTNLAKELRSHQVAENKRIMRLRDEMNEQAKARFEQIAAQGKLSKEDEQLFNNIYGEAYKQTLDQEAKGKLVGQKVIGKFNPVALFGQSVLGGLNRSIAAKGKGLVSMGLNGAFTDYLRGFQEGADRYETLDNPLEGANLFDPNTYLTRIGKQLGNVVPTVAATMLTRSPIVGGTIGWVDETMQGAGDVYEQALREGFDEVEAKNKAAKFASENAALLPLYFVESLGILKASKGFKGALKGGALQLGGELGTEIPQSYFEQSKSKYGKELGEYLKEDAPEVALETAIGTLGQAGAMSISGQALKALSIKTKVEQQFLSDLTAKRGLNFANSIVEQQYFNGIINEQELGELKATIGKIYKLQNGLSDMGLNDEQRRAFIGVSEEIESLKEQVSSTDNPTLYKSLQEQIKEKEKLAQEIISNTAELTTFQTNTGTEITIPTEQAKEVQQDESFKEAEKQGLISVIKPEDVKKPQIAEKPEPKVAVITPEENARPLPITIGSEKKSQRPDAATIETKSPKVILPQSNQAPNVVEKKKADDEVVSYEEAIKVTPTSELTDIEQYGTDELGREAKTAAIRDQEKTPPTFTKHKTGTYAADRYGDLHQLQEVPLDMIVLPEGENKREETVEKYRKWYKEGSEFPPAKGVENFAVYKGKVVINDGHHRVVAAKKEGLKSIPVWVSLTDPQNPARPIQSVEYHKSLSKPTTNETIKEEGREEQTLLKEETPKQSGTEEVVADSTVPEVEVQTAKPSIEDFTQRMIDYAESVKDSSFDFRLDVPLSQVERDGAIKDIRAGKQSKRREKFETALKEMHDKGVVSVNRGRGNHAESIDVPFEDWFDHPLDSNKLDAAAELPEETARIINEEDITLNNLESLKNLFNGFPYTKEQYQAVQQHLNTRENKGDAEVGQTSGSSNKKSESKQEEVTPEKQLADKIRSKKLKGGGLKSEIIPTFGLPEKIVNKALDMIADQVEKGTNLGKAIAKAIRWIDEQVGGTKWDRKGFANHASKTHIVTINGKKELVERDDSKETAEVINGFYSPLEQRLIDTKEQSLPEKKWIERLNSDEAKWTGLIQFLQSKPPTETISKKQIQDFLKENRIEISEVVKGETARTESQISADLKEKGYTYEWDMDGQTLILYRGDVEVDYGEVLPDDIQNLIEELGETKGVHEGGESSTKYFQYQLSGEKENYREVLVTLPSKAPKNPLHEKREALIPKMQEARRAGNHELANKIDDEISQITKQLISENSINSTGQPNIFKSSHWDEPNILVHLRMNTRKDSEGRRVLFIEELQSDWGQKGKREGFMSKEREGLVKRLEALREKRRETMRMLEDFKRPDWEQLNKRDGQIADEIEDIKEFMEQRGYSDDAVQSAPFVTDTNSWTKLGLKTALKYAVQEDAEVLAWTSGSQQNERYDLSKTLSSVDYWNVGGKENGYGITAYDKSESIVYKQSDLTLKQIEDTIGKEAAEKIKNNEGATEKLGQTQYGTLSNANLKIQGKGMKGFYGEPSENKEGIIGGVAKSLVRELTGGDVEVGEAKLAIGEKAGSNFEIQKNDEGLFTIYDKTEDFFINNQENPNGFKAKAEAEAYAKEYFASTEESSTQHSIPITPELKESIKQGMPLFGEAKPKSKLQQLADKIRKDGVLPDFLKADLPNGTKKAGFSEKGLAEAAARALETIDKVYQVTKDAAKAIREGFKVYRAYYEQNAKKINADALWRRFEEGAKKYMEEKGVGEEKKTTRKKSLLNRLVDAENISNELRERLKEQGLEYVPQSHEEALAIARKIIEEEGYDNAVMAARAQTFGGDVNTLIQTEALDKLARDGDAATGIEQIELAQKFAEIETELDKWLREKAGRGISALNYFYKKSPLGIQMVENKKRREEFEKWSKDKEKSWKETFDELMKQPEFADIVKSKIQEQIKQERAAARLKRQSKVHKAIDDTMSKWAKKFKPKTDMGDAEKMGVGADEVFALAGAAMKKAYDAGESVAKIVQDAIDFITEKLGVSGWGEEEFRSEWTAALEESDGAKQSAEEAYKNRLRKQIADLDKQIENKKRDYKPKKEREYDEETQKLIDERNRKKEILNEVTGQKEASEAIINRMLKKIKGLTDKQKEEVVKASIKLIVENDGLDYSEFRDIIGRITGRGEMTAEEATKMRELIAKTNTVEELGKKAREIRTEEARVAVRAAQLEAGMAARELNELLSNKPNIMRRLTSIMQLSTLGIPALVNNPIYNIWNQATLRLPVGLINDTIDRVLAGVFKLGGKEYAREYNVWETQADFFKGLGLGSQESFEQLITGLNRQDYIAKELYGQSIRPKSSWKDLIAAARGKKKLSRRQIVDKALQGTWGIPAEIIARVLNLGDKPQRFGAERSQAAAFAKELGLKGIDYRLFIDFPREEALYQYKKQGLSDDAAAKKADLVKEAIIQEGKRSTFQQDNLLNDLLNRVFGGEGSGVGGFIKSLTISPYIKIPSNAFWSYYNLVNPEIAILQVARHGIQAARIKDNETQRRMQIREARYWFAHAIVGVAMRAVVTSMVAAGIFTPAADDDDSKKEREGEAFFQPQGTININKLKAWLRGEDPSKIKGGLLVQNRWFGQWGTVGNAIAKKHEDMTPEQREAQMEFWNIAIGGMEKDALKEMEQGVFSNTSSLLSSLGSGSYGGQRYLSNTIGLFTNIVHPAAFAQMSRAQLPYYVKGKADSFTEGLKIQMLNRSSFLRNLTGQYPPSKISIWGEPMMKVDDKAKALGIPLMRLFGVTLANGDNFAQPIYEDAKKTGDIGFFPPSVKPELNGHKLNTQQAAVLETYIGQARKEYVAPYINDAAYIDGFDMKYSEIKDMNVRKRVLEYLYGLGRQAGVAKFLNDFPQFRRPDEKTEEQEEFDMMYNDFKEAVNDLEEE